MLPLWWSIMDEQRELWHVKPLREAEEEEQSGDGREEPKKEMAAENLIMVLFKKYIYCCWIPQRMRRRAITEGANAARLA